MSLIDSLILAIVEGLTEFFPISSTGHLIIASKFLGLSNDESSMAFNIFIQLGAVMAVVLRERAILFESRMMKLLIISFIPTGIIGFLGKKLLNDFLGDVRIVAWSLLVGGILFLFIERLIKKTNKTIYDLSIKDCLLIGVVQSFALVPGVSRSASALVGGLVGGLNRGDAARYSFLLAVPTLGAAALYKSKDLFAGANDPNLLNLFLALALCFLVSWLAMDFCIRLVKRYGLAPFGVYRIVLGLLLLLNFF